MESQRFNLWDESWIYVTDEQFVLRKVSLMEALCNAHHFRDLAGETETQNFAMLRLLLAVLLTVFTRCDENGTDSPIEQPQQALKRWETIWNNGQFPAKPIQDYCNHWHQRFWLFDDSHPFFQVPEIDGTQNPAKKMNGALVESKNKVQLFSLRNGIQKEQLDNDEAARWLVYLQSFGDCAAKKPSPKMSWVGSIGCVFAKGETLFETLMLNFTLLKNSNELWGTPKPSWECNTPKTEKLTEIAMPDNLPELYTLQCRRVKLQCENGVVNSYIEAAGDYFEKESAFVEQMTFWAKKEEKGVEVIYPKIHDATRQMWRDFPTIMGIKGEKCGVMKWIARLKTNNCLEKTKMVSFQIVGVVYGSMCCGISDEFSDSLQFHATLLQDFRRELQEKISKEVENCEKLATAVYRLAEELEKACGGDGKTASKHAKEQFYHHVDIPFRQWLAELEPQQTPKEENQALKSWRKTAQTIARTLGREMVEQCGIQGFIGKKVKEKKNNKETEHQYNAPKAYQWFLYQTKL